jgi:hypothetical protein
LQLSSDFEKPLSAEIPGAQEAPPQKHIQTETTRQDGSRASAADRSRISIPLHQVQRTDGCVTLTDMTFQLHKKEEW